MMSGYSKIQKGFTIVELLIVIVVIAILAAISIVAYAGIQERGRDAAHQQEASQTERQIMTHATLQGGDVTDVSGKLVGSQEGVGERKLLRPLTGTPDITMYMVCTTVATNTSYNNITMLTPDSSTHRLALRTGETSSTLMGTRIDTPSQSNATTLDPKAVRIVGDSVIGWLEVSNNATVRLSAYNQAAPTNAVTTLIPGVGWNFTGIKTQAQQFCDSKVALVFNAAHDQATRASIIDWLAERYNVSL